MAIEVIRKVPVYSETPKAEAKTAEQAPAVTALEPKVVKTSTLQKDGTQEGPEQDNELSQKQIKTAINDANSKMKNTKTKCEFSYHEPTKRVSIKILDKETDEVIREVPPEETLKMIEKLWELAGIMIDEKR